MTLASYRGNGAHHKGANTETTMRAPPELELMVKAKSGVMKAT